MVKVNSPFFSSSASGSIKKTLQAGALRETRWMRAAVHRSYTCTNLQLPQRLKFQEAKNAWIALSPAEKAAYNVFANTLRPPITGYNYFLRLYLTAPQPIPPPIEENISLLHFDGEQDSQIFIDETGKLWTAHNTARLDRSASRFGSASGLFEFGGWNCITTPFTEDWDSGSGPFTYELFANIATIRDYSTLLFLGSDTGSYLIFYIYNTGIRVDLFTEEFNSYLVGGDVELHPGFWDHIAFERDCGLLSIFLNGFVVGDEINIGNDHMPSHGTTPLQIGTLLEQYDGHIDEFRFKLEAVPPSSFPPTQPY